ncbi:MAG: cobalamin-independent methionine synthase II family protein [Pseudomonadota bacterium]
MLTTTIGAYPKPDNVPLPDWFRTGGQNEPAKYSAALANLTVEDEAAIDRAVARVVRDQVDAGIDIPTDGEVRRENYIHYHCRHLAGFDFEQLRDKPIRGGAQVLTVPSVQGPVAAGAPFLPRDWRIAQGATDKPVKITLPGPMTISDTVVDEHYGDPRALGRDLAVTLNQEIKALAEAGCRVVQIDEPVFARRPEAALAYGIENLERAFAGVPGTVQRVVHACCGYPERLDQEDYLKASPESYVTLSDALEAADFHALSLEDAHRHNDLRLFERFPTKTLIVGVVAIASSRIEPAEEIRARLAAILGHIEPQRLIAAPDCGLGYLSPTLAVAKLTNLAAAAHSLP